MVGTNVKDTKLKAKYHPDQIHKLGLAMEKVRPIEDPASSSDAAGSSSGGSFCGGSGGSSGGSSGVGSSGSSVISVCQESTKHCLLGITFPFGKGSASVKTALEDLQKEEKDVKPKSQLTFSPSASPCSVFSSSSFSCSSSSYSSSSGSSTTPKHCPLRDTSPFKKFRRNNQCKYCRRPLGSPMSLLFSRGGGKPLSSSSAATAPPQSSILFPRPAAAAARRRPLESPLDEVAWACGRLWCSVRRRKRRKITENRQRKQINEAFSTLREILPPAAQTEYEDSAAAKVSTLRLAASYIQALSDLLKDTHLTDRSPTKGGGEKTLSLKEEDLEGTLSSLTRSSKSTSEEMFPSKRGPSSPAMKIPKNIYKTDKKMSLVKSLSGKEAPLECV